MGLIRKSLAVGTVGLVRPSSKKQRNQKALIKQAKVANRLSALQLQAQLRAETDAQQALLHAQAQTAYLQAQALAARPQQALMAGQPTVIQPAAPAAAAGWYADPYGAPVQRYWDGAQWTGQTSA